MASDYEKQRLQNLADNRRILEEIGLTKKFTATPKVTFKKCIRALKRKAENEVTEIKPPAKKAAVLDPESSGSVRGTRRRSARIMGQEVQTKEEMDQEVKEWEEENEENRHIPVPAHRPNMYGAIENVEMGTWWPTRMECCRAGIHRPTVAGIHGGQEGAYSIALSGGYDDNVDLGEAFTYTGEGGRDLKGTANNPKNLRTAPQSKDQELSRGNLALSRNIETGNPVRVIRGYKLTSPFAPEEGYRYDGLYMVEKAWFTQGLSGFMVWKFALRRVQDQPPPPWTIVEDDAENVDKENVSPNKNKLMRSDSHQSGDSGVDMSADEKQTVLEDVSEETEIENETHPNEDGQNDDGNDGNNDKIKKETLKSPVKAGKNVDSDDGDCSGNDRSDDEIKDEASTNPVTDNEKNGNNDEEDKSDEGNSSDKDNNDGEKDSG